MINFAQSGSVTLDGQELLERAPRLIEELFRVMLAVADRGYVLENGRVVRHGPGRELLGDPAVVAAYLGGPA